VGSPLKLPQPIGMGREKWVRRKKRLKKRKGCFRVEHSLDAQLEPRKMNGVEDLT